MNYKPFYRWAEKQAEKHTSRLYEKVAYGLIILGGTGLLFYHAIKDLQQRPQLIEKSFSVSDTNKNHRKDYSELKDMAKNMGLDSGCDNLELMLRSAPTEMHKKYQSSR